MAVSIRERRQSVAGNCVALAWQRQASAPGGINGGVKSVA